ncbi:hypothetical protein OAL01_01355 [Rubripirellula sp.]|nr:hypothetical protein [Rubripirellula sp.]
MRSVKLVVTAGLSLLKLETGSGLSDLARIVTDKASDSADPIPTAGIFAA